MNKTSEQWANWLSAQRGISTDGLALKVVREIILDFAESEADRAAAYQVLLGIFTTLRPGYTTDGTLHQMKRVIQEAIVDLEARTRADERERIVKLAYDWFIVEPLHLDTLLDRIRSHGPTLQDQCDAVKAAIRDLFPPTYRCALCNAGLVEAQLSRYGEMLLHFDGAEWCGPCIPIRKERKR
jgi:DNA-binding response OmpR family regulator